MRRALILGGCVLLILVVLKSSSGSWLQSCIIDGQFDDWRGRANISDPKSDGPSGQDLKAIYWNTNLNDKNLYFMAETFPSDIEGNIKAFRLYFDINSNNSYKNAIDKYVELIYTTNHGGNDQLDVRVCSITGQTLSSCEGRGETLPDGSSRFEFAVPMDDLQVYAAQNIRFYLTGVGGDNLDRLPDKGDVQWSPFPINVQNKYGLLAAFFIWLIMTIFFYRQRIWVFYYIWGAVGLCCFIILFFRGSMVEFWIELQTSYILQYILSHFGVVTYVFDKAPGTLLVLIKLDNNWTTIDIDMENSGFLEMAICLGLIIFYPLYNFFKRSFVALAGVMAVYLINILRVVMVVLTIHAGGRNMSFIAHTLIGRTIFFALIVALYWELLTRPSIKKISEYVRND
jgi:exosortase family protein XrtG